MIKRHRRNPNQTISNAAMVRTHGSDTADIVRRAMAAGAVAPLTWLGTGQDAVVFCDASGRGWKVARELKPWNVSTIENEAEWLATAMRIPGVAEHVVRFVAWHPTQGVIERECVKARDRWQINDHRLLVLHNRIGLLMAPYGWTSPEYKADAWIVTADRGPVLVDAGRAVRIGWRAARYAADILVGHRRPKPGDSWASLRFGIEADEARKRLPTHVARRLAERLRARENPPMHHQRPFQVVPPKLLLKPNGDYLEIIAKDGRKVVGRLNVEKLNPYYGKMEKLLAVGGCAEGYVQACRHAGKSLHVFVIGVVEILDGAYRDTGLGVDLYVAAAQWAASRGGVLAATECYMGTGTSDDAMRVWNSKRFRSRVRSFGRVVWGGSADG